MEVNNNKYTFSGHESFPCKTLWLKKGYDFIGKRNYISYEERNFSYRTEHGIERRNKCQDTDLHFARKGQKTCVRVGAENKRDTFGQQQC